MKTNARTLFALVLGITSLVGCAAPTEDESADSSDEALSTRQLPGVAAVEIAELRSPTVLSSKTVGAPKKVKSLVSTVKKLRPSESVPRCMERDTVRLTFLDTAGKKVATVENQCGSFGHISFEDGRGYPVKFSVDAVDAVKNAPLAVGDALWGVDKIELSKRGSAAKVLTGEAMEPVLDGIDLNQVPDARAPTHRCVPSYSVHFKRADNAVAYASFLCGATNADDAPATLKGQFYALEPGASDSAPPLARGAVQLDPRPIMRAFESSTSD